MPAMNALPLNSYTSFQGHRLIKSGPLSDVALAVKRVMEASTNEPVLIFDDRTGRSIDIDTHGSDADVLARFASNDASDEAGTVAKVNNKESRGRGRPKLGVIAREVTLLPRHWEWLAMQPGGASVALRKLVDEARRELSAGIDEDLKDRREPRGLYHAVAKVLDRESGERRLW